MAIDVNFWNNVSKMWSKYSNTQKIKEITESIQVSNDGKALNSWLDGADDELD